MAIASPDRAGIGMPIPSWEREWNAVEHSMVVRQEMPSHPPRTEFQRRLLELPRDAQLFIGYAYESSHPHIPAQIAETFGKEEDRLIDHMPKPTLSAAIKVMAWRALNVPQEPWVNFFPK